MPTPISGPRQARSMVSPAGGGSPVTRVIDFNFAANQGIEIFGILGSIYGVDQTPAPSDTAATLIHAAQSLHLEEGTIEDIPFDDGEDADQIDTEVFFEMDAAGLFQTGTTNTFGAGGSAASAVLYVPYAKPILVARNITHRGEDADAGQTAQCRVLIFYQYVVFSLAELGLILARRQ